MKFPAPEKSMVSAQNGGPLQEDGGRRKPRSRQRTALFEGPLETAGSNAGIFLGYLGDRVQYE